MYKTEKGITIIELMIVISVIAILVLIAIPAYNDYTIRSKVAECVDNAAVGKVSISEYRQTLGAWPGSIEEAGLAFTGDTTYCEAFTDYEPSSGAFTVDVDEAAIDDNLSGSLAPVLRPVETLSLTIMWTCTRGSTDEGNVKYLPPICRGS